jgi:glyoxylase-like metal-dependent hydrolase (beta-lactamase superfamily II)
MAGASVRIISLGALAAHPLWGEPAPVRTGHATTSLVRSGKRVILVDPGLPEAVIAARLHERSGLRPADVTHVFLTSFSRDCRRGIGAFDKAVWWISEAEREAVGVPLVGVLHKAVADGDEDVKKHVERDIAVLRACQPAPDHLAENVDLFPLPGVTPGLCGLLVAAPRTTTLICGDAVATSEHLEKGLVLDSAADVTRARESFGEALEIADALVLGRDNLTLNPVRRPF